MASPKTNRPRGSGSPTCRTVLLELPHQASRSPDADDALVEPLSVDVFLLDVGCGGAGDGFGAVESFGLLEAAAFAAAIEWRLRRQLRSFAR
jgi:hypothetical protein